MHWEPLPLIVYGYAVHPLTPSRRDTRISSRTRLSTVTEASANDDNGASRDVVSLEVGDEVYAFEKYTPKAKEVEGIWYRGYVVCTARRPPVTWSVHTDPSSSAAGMRVPTKSEEPQQVFIGIFPASHIHVRDKLSDAEGRLADLATTLHTTPLIPHSEPPHWNNGSAGLDIMKEEEEDILRKSSFRLGPPPDQAKSSRAGLPVHPASIRSPSPTESHIKPLPPRPSLKSGDDTASGASQPIIDEISSALREWHTLMFQYLAKRDYKLFHTVREHIEALHLGRRQLLAQTLSTEETINMRRDCVTRLVSGNIVQGLDVIVRHPTWGGLVTVDTEINSDPRSWVSAVRMYAMQISLTYLDVSPSGGRNSNSLSRSMTIHTQDNSLVPLPTPAHSAFPEYSRHRKTRSRSLGCLGPADETSKATAAKFYHVFLDVRAFVASLCSPGETVELFFSLYSKDQAQFITEDFCAVLNHNGVLARDPAAKIRSLFVDLALADVESGVWLVCKIVRNGSLKIGSNMSSGMGSVPSSANSTNTRDSRRSEASSRAENFNSASVWAEPPPGYGTNGIPNRAYGDSPSQFRRPFGCAVLELTQLAQMVEESGEISSTKEHGMPIYVPTNESLFSMLHQDIIAGNNKEFEKSPRAEMLAVSVKIFHGNASTIVRENTSMLQDTPLTLRLGFPDVVFPGDVRNELYVKLWSGDFASHGNSGRLSVASFRGGIGPATNNVQVTVEVRDQEGRTVENVISQGSGEPLMTQFHSMVFQRCNQPTYGELIKLQLPMDSIPQWHLFFTFRNRTGREKSRSNHNSDGSVDKPFAFAFQPLFPDHRAIEDGSHTLVLYRADRIGQLTHEMYLAAAPWLVAGQKLEQITIPAEMLRVAPPMKDSLTLRSSLCSTKFTQNSVLLKLLSWETVTDKELLSTILAKFTFVGEVEIVKFLRDIFDSLFGILVSQNNTSGEMDHLVFNALVTVLGIVQDRRFSNFQPVLDVYIEQHFNCAAASSHIIHSMNKLLANPTSNESASPLRAALKVWHYVFKFLARSRELQKAKELGMGGGATAEHLEMKFKRELSGHLTEVTRMMSTVLPPSIIGTQTIALQHFTSILPELAKIYTTVELVMITTTFANAMSTGKGKIVIWKLILYLQIVKGFLFDSAQSRLLLVETVVSWIKPYFGRFDEFSVSQSNETEMARDAARVAWLEGVRLCVTIVAVMLDKLQLHLVTPEIIADRSAFAREQENVEYLLSLLPRLLDSYREFQNPASLKAIERTQSPATVKTSVPVTFPESYPFSLISSLPKKPQTTQSIPFRAFEETFNPGLGETAIVFLVLILSAPKKHILNHLDTSLEIEGREKFVTFLSQFFTVATSILENDAFPKTWLNVNILAHKVLVKIMDPIGTLLERDFIPQQDAASQFDVKLWREAFYMLLKLLSSDQLVIEEFSPQKRRAVWRLAGDIRGEGASIMLSLWQSLGWEEQVSPTDEVVVRFGGYQVYLNSLVGHVVNLCLSHHDQLRNNAVQILYSMIVSEYHQSEHFDDIENELVNRLDSLFMSDSKGDDISRAFFIGQLRHLFDGSDVDDQLRERVSGFLDSVDLFLELLLSVRALPEGEEFADDRVIATLRLMNFIRRIGRDEIYIKYVHQLVNMHLQSQNYVEAALTLKLHSDLHEWNLNSFVGPMEDLGLPQQSQFHRKETLCLLILDYMGKGKAWESAIEICKELAYQHAEVTFNYGRLSEILRHQAALLEHIVTDQRYYSDYFRVAFYGNFPVAIRGKQFVYRGYEWEKFGAFCERMLNKHPGAQLLKAIGEPPVDVKFGNDQYIQCTSVTPEPDRNMSIFTNPDVPLAVRTYYEHSAINLFSCSRQVKKNTLDGSEEVWVEKTYFTTEETFPTVLRRSEVVGIRVEEISPVENALMEVLDKTKELEALNLKYTALSKTAQVVSTNALAMCLNSAVDAPINMGVSAYRNTFFNPDYLARNPKRTEHVEQLRAAIDQQVRVIDSCLKLHGQLCPPEFLPFHETLERFFKKNFHEEIRRLAVDGMSDDSPSLRSHNMTGSSTYQSSLYGESLQRSMSSTSTSRPFVIPPLQVGLGAMTPPIMNSHSRSQTEQTEGAPAAKQTPLQRNLAHLARHGINGVSSAPGSHLPREINTNLNGKRGGSGSLNESMSPSDSFVNVGNNGLTHGVAAAQMSATSVVSSNLGSLKGRFSRFGSLNFGRRGANGSSASGTT